MPKVGAVERAGCPGLTTLAEKNRVMAKGPERPGLLKAIPRPKGSIGQKGFSLIEHMQLDPEKEEEKGLYSNILVSGQGSRGSVPISWRIRPPFARWLTPPASTST